MRIVPVLDVLEGQVVRGMAGRRSEYRPIRSALCADSAPLAVAHAFRERFGLTHLYLADLDAIATGEPNIDLYRRLVDDGFSLMVDAGLRRAEEVDPLLTGGVVEVVAGLETVASPGELVRMLERIGSDGLVFSLDSKEGIPLIGGSEWPSSAEAILESVLESGIRRVLLLDLARVGMDRGVGSEALARAARLACPDAFLIVGGGIRGAEDLDRLRHEGVQAALVATALHDGRLSADDVCPDR